MSPEETNEEFDFLFELDHPNIVRYLLVQQDIQGSVHIITEPADRNLEAVIQARMKTGKPFRDDFILDAIS